MRIYRMEDRMKTLSAYRMLLIVALVFVTPAITSGGSKVEGTYTNTGGMVTLDVRSGGKAALTLMGDNYPCTYKVSGDKVMLDCSPKGEKVDFIIHDDGSLSGPGFIGVMKKSK
jgi:hypothetical protein